MLVIYKLHCFSHILLIPHYSLCCYQLAYLIVRYQFLIIISYVLGTVNICKAKQ